MLVSAARRRTRWSAEASSRWSTSTAPRACRWSRCPVRRSVGVTPSSYDTRSASSDERLAASAALQRSLEGL